MTNTGKQLRGLVIGALAARSMIPAMVGSVALMTELARPASAQLTCHYCGCTSFWFFGAEHDSQCAYPNWGGQDCNAHVNIACNYS